MSELLNKANEYERLNKNKVDKQRPLFHLTGGVGWISDPNGFSFYKDEYHMFYQYYPFDTYFGPMFWGHTVSRDLLNWTHKGAVMALEIVDPLILIPVFITDFLCVHPFNDSNGRMSRLMTLLLLYKSGFAVGKYISIEKQIEKTKNTYYDVLQEIDHGWHEETNDQTPFIRYMLELILACYVEFEEKVGMMDETGMKSSAYDLVKAYADQKLGKFTANDVISNCPSI